jgi:hypothetical protein
MTVNSHDFMMTVNSHCFSCSILPHFVILFYMYPVWRVPRFLYAVVLFCGFLKQVVALQQLQKINCFRPYPTILVLYVVELVFALSMNEMFATRRYGLMIAYRPINSISALFRTTTGIIIYRNEGYNAEIMIVYNSSNPVWRVPRFLYAVVLFCGFLKQVVALQQLQKINWFNVTHLRHYLKCHLIRTPLVKTDR